jgi:hypothetical protein
LGSKPSITKKKKTSTQKRKIFSSKPSPIIRNKTLPKPSILGRRLGLKLEPNN